MYCASKVICMTGGHGWQEGIEADGKDACLKAVRTPVSYTHLAATKAPNIGTRAPIPTTSPIKNAYGIFMIKDPAVTKLAKIKHSKQVPPT